VNDNAVTTPTAPGNWPVRPGEASGGQDRPATGQKKITPSTTLLITPPADVAAILAGSQTVIAVQGEPCRGCITTTEPHAAWGENGQPPPADLVAATEACERCNGSGDVQWEVVGRSGDVEPRGMECDACNGRGTPPVEFYTTCEACRGRGHFDHGAWDEHGAFAPYICASCTDGRVVHGTVGISEVLPVVEHRAVWPTGSDVIAVGPMNGGQLVRTWRWQGERWGYDHDLTDQLRFLPPPTTLTGGWFICLLNNPQGATP
jgi:hypothetical protein